MTNEDLAELRDSEERLRMMVDGATDYAFITLDPGGRIIGWSPGSEQVFGWSADDCLGQMIDMIFTPEDRANGQPERERRSAIERGYAPDIRWHLRADGRRVFINGSMRPLPPGPDGALRGLVKIGRDETAQELQAQELKRARDDLAVREAALRDLNASLEARVIAEVHARLEAEGALRQAQKMEAIGQLTGGVAHDFNNLLTVMRSSVDLLRRPGLAEEKRLRYLDAIATTSERAAKLTAQLLAFSRRQALKPEVFDAAERVRATGDMLRTILGARIVLTMTSDCATCFVDADVAQFETAIVNLAVNARDAMDGEGRLTITIDAAVEIPPVRDHPAARGPFVAVHVADTGSGIAEADLPKIFEPFFTTKGVGKGTGLGLSQVYGFAKQSGGEVDVDSQPGAGTTFTLYLPQVRAVRRAPVARAENEGDPRGRVLVVEDNAQVGDFAAQLLADLGYEPVHVANAAAALDALDGESDFDVVFSDVVMPGMNGVELARRIRAVYPELPIVLTSGYADVLSREGPPEFPVLDKPYSADGLMRALQDALRT